MAEQRIDLDAHPRRAKVRLRLGMSAASEAARLGLPGTLEAKTSAEVTVLSLGPDQWLLVSDQLSSEKLVAMCANQFADVTHHAVDVSAALNCATVQGASTPALLSMGAGVDWSAKCIRTRFAAVAVVAHRHHETSFDIYYDRSLRDYLRQWLDHALRDPLLAHG
ncbi:sarcosine oxidase subunit gamma family protein [Steroidobacter cummioxidans]|uniref:sarcosine oxidase subunit gamma family protein n=1 Tax=Steroidobacter cummioxidans TaxID=1803913 RepID=UPI000E324848|nr:sarcosine oxidase subunit gamma family protein [Steroidobacter cummioxidans]